MAITYKAAMAATAAATAAATTAAILGFSAIDGPARVGNVIGSYQNYQSEPLLSETDITQKLAECEGGDDWFIKRHWGDVQEMDAPSMNIVGILQEMANNGDTRLPYQEASDAFYENTEFSNVNSYGEIWTGRFDRSIKELTKIGLVKQETVDGITFLSLGDEYFDSRFAAYCNSQFGGV